MTCSSTRRGSSRLRAGARGSAAPTLPAAPPAVPAARARGPRAQRATPQRTAATPCQLATAPTAPFQAGPARENDSSSAPFTRRPARAQAGDNSDGIVPGPSMRADQRQLTQSTRGSGQSRPDNNVPRKPCVCARGHESRSAPDCRIDMSLQPQQPSSSSSRCRSRAQC